MKFWQLVLAMMLGAMLWDALKFVLKIVVKSALVLMQWPPSWFPPGSKYARRR